jgi:uncharacterized phiE125 gp8 family phage protein
MSYAVTSPPLTEPISAADFRSFHLNVDDSTEETGIDELVVSVRSYLERQFDKAFITQTITEKYCYWAAVHELTVSPVASIASLKYYAPDNTVLQTLAATKYKLQKNRITAEVWFNDTMDYPDIDTERPEPIEIEYVAGEAAAPANIKHQLRQCVARLYFDREAFSTVMSNVELMWPEIRVRV